MSDAYKLEKLMLLLLQVVKTTGLALLNTPMDYYHSIGVDTTLMDETMAELRSIIYEAEEMLMNPLSLQYTDGMSLSTGDSELWKSDFYANDVQTLCQLPAIVRENAYSIHVRDMNDRNQLPLLLDKINATVLYMSVARRYIVPFFPSVTKLVIPVIEYHDIRAYLDTVVELSVAWFDVRTYEFMCKAKKLQYINIIQPQSSMLISITEINTDNIRKVLERRRETSNLPVLGFKFGTFVHNQSQRSDKLIKCNDELLRELQHHKLKVMGVTLYHLDEFQDLIESQPKLETLFVYVDIDNIAKMVEMMKGYLPNLTRISIHIMDPNDAATAEEAAQIVNDSLVLLLSYNSNIKEIAIDGKYADREMMPSTDVIELVKRNVTRSKKLGEGNIAKALKKLAVPLDQRRNFLGFGDSILKCVDVIPMTSPGRPGVFVTNVPHINKECEELYGEEEIEELKQLNMKMRTYRKSVVERRGDKLHQVKDMSPLIIFDPDVSYYDD